MRKGFTPEEVYELSRLKDLYEGLLPERQKEIVHLKLDEDLSLGEIAERLGISRQACEDALKRCYKALSNYEEKLGMRRKETRLEKQISEIIRLMESMNVENWEGTKSSVLTRLKLMMGSEK